MQIQHERRNFVRLNPVADVVYHKREAKEEGRLSLSKNISAGGICLIAYEELKKSDVLELEIFLPGDTLPMRSIGKVVWVKEFSIGDKIGKRYDVGVEFIGVSNKDLEKINQYVFNHIPPS